MAGAANFALLDDPDDVDDADDADDAGAGADDAVDDADDDADDDDDAVFAGAVQSDVRSAMSDVVGCFLPR